MRKTILLLLGIELSATSGQANADYIVGIPANLGPTVNSSARDEEPGIMADGLSIYSSDFNTTCFNKWMEITAVFCYDGIDGV